MSNRNHSNNNNNTVQFNLRIKTDIMAILQQIADDMNLTAGTLGTKIITDYVEFFYYKIQRGDVTLSQPILKTIFEALDSDMIDGIAKKTADYIISEIKAQEGNVTYEILIEHFSKWNKGNHLLFNRIKQKGSDMFVSKHSICRNWSEIQCKTYANTFETIGETILEKDYDSDDSYSLRDCKSQIKLFDENLDSLDLLDYHQSLPCLRAFGFCS